MRALAKKFNKNWQELYAVFYTKYFNLAAENKISEIDADRGIIKIIKRKQAHESAQKL